MKKDVCHSQAGSGLVYAADTNHSAAMGAKLQ